jgi:hypothetical protein
MRRSFFRPVLFGCICAIAASVPAHARDKEPKSNNKDKIVGKWKLTGGTDLEALETFKAVVFLEFADDGTASLGVEVGDPEFKKLLEKSDQKTTFGFKYKLGAGDDLELYDLPKDLQEKQEKVGSCAKDRRKCVVKIDGDKMTLTDDQKKTIELKKLPKDK